MAILRELTQAHMVLPARPGVTPSNREISRKLKVPPGTVRYRIRRMYSSGVLRGSSVLPNPNLLGLKFGAFVVDVSPKLDKALVVEKLLHTDGALYMHDFVGSLVWVGFAYEGDRDLDGKVTQMSEIAGSEGKLSRIPYPPYAGTLTGPEAELVLRLIRGGFESYKGLAKEMGVSGRTLERKVSKLASSGAVFSLPKVHYESMTNCVPADVHITFKDAGAVTASGRKILEILGGSLVFAALWDNPGMCSAIFPSVGPVTGIVDRIKGVEGVTAVRVDIVRERMDQARALERPLERWMAARGEKPPAQRG